MADIKTDFLYTKGEQSITEYRASKTCSITHDIPHRTVASDINLRAGYNRHDYDAKRPNDKLPTEHAEIIRACQAVYRRVGMVRNIIDLMTDFAAEGLELQHPVKSQERFFREWARRVNLSGRAHDFMKLLMRDANVIVRRKTALLMKPAVKEMAKADVVSIDTVDETKVEEKPEKINITKKKIPRREIPWKYTFLSPVTIEKIGGEVGRFFGAEALGMRIPISLARRIKNPRTDAEREYVNKLPAEVIRAARKGIRLVGLDMGKIYVDYYKKDDWEDWGTPFLFGVLEDVMFKEKMRLADMAALDGVINVIRLWKLGKSDQMIMPTGAAVDKLINILETNIGGGVMDLVWDDMIDLQVEYPPTDKILGADKYKGVNADIVRGLGIPDSLIGGSDLGTRNAQSAFVQLKTLVERLEYVRSRAIRWMEGELRLLADAMGYKKTPEISFGIMSLRDEAAEKQLIIQLLDRGVISAEKVSEVFGTNFMIEVERQHSEQQIRENSPGILEKAGPYYRPMSIMEKQNELAIKLEKAKQSAKSGGDSQTDNGGGDNPAGDQPRNDGNNSPGRPPATKDTKPRDERTPRTESMLYLTADRMIADIDRLIDVSYLRRNNIKNMRSITKAQRDQLDRVKRGILSVLQPCDVVTRQLISDRLSVGKIRSIPMEACFVELMKDFTASTQREPTSGERRILTGLAWSRTMELKGV